MKRWLCILFGLLAFGNGLLAMDDGQETIVVGDVYDAYTGEAIPNVNIYFQGTPLGTMTNAEGMFLLRGYIDRTRTMTVSAVGYHTERFRIEAGQQVGIEVALKEKVGSLGDVFVFPGENPALALMDSVRRYRFSNQRTVDMQQANAQMALMVSDIQTKHLQRNLWKNLQSGMLQAEDSSYFIPLYWRKQQATEIEEQATLLSLTDYHVLLNQLQSTCNFYDSHIEILSATLLSPLASSGNTYYRYFLADSVQVGNEKHYIVHFRTKNAFYATFNGEMTIDSATYALRRIEATVPAQNSINFLRQLTIQQTFAQNQQLENENMSLLLDFAIKADSTKIFPTLLIQRNTQLPLSESGIPTLESPILSLDSGIQNPHSPSPITNAIDSLNNTPLFKTAKFFAHIFQTGYIPTTTPIEIGKVYELIKYNQAEGVRLALPIRTNEKLWKRVSLEGFVAYGTGDRAWKGMGQVSVQLPTQRRHIFQARYSDRYIYSDVDHFSEYIRENSVFNPQIHLITEIIRGLPFNKRFYYNTMVRQCEGLLQFEDDWNSYLETQTYLKFGRMGSRIPSKIYDPEPSFGYATLGASVRLSFNERKVDSYFHRRHIYNHLPVLYLGAELGSYQTLYMDTYQLYGNLQFLLRHHVDLGMAGKLNYLLQAGVIFGKVPYPLLHIFAANPTYTFDMQRYTLMNTYQYASDYYVSLQAMWDGKGVLFNLIPGLRYLRLRELLELKVAYGGIRNDHQSVLPFPMMHSSATQRYDLLSPLTTPYVEVGVGIGNILRFGEVHAVFRLTDIHSPFVPWWGIRFRLSLGL